MVLPLVSTVTATLVEVLIVAAQHYVIEILNSKIYPTLEPWPAATQKATQCPDY